jgi:pimeloyl-ACP methyl ester carboxylesterase
VLPGSGSDRRFVSGAFSGPLASVGVELSARGRQGDRRAGGLVERYRGALDDAAAEDGPLVVGGVSVGAHVAVQWAVEQLPALGSRLRGVLLAMPAWTGEPGEAPAARAALASAADIRRDGLAATLRAVRADSPRWLGDELTMAWGGYGAALAADLAAAGRHPGPGIAELRRLDVPVGLAAMTDDPLHPLEVAQRWLSALPRAALVTSTLGALGADMSTLGRAAVLAWLRARAF